MITLRKTSSCVDVRRFEVKFLNILLLGNGFDLYYQLPTKYINFINTVDFLACHIVGEPKTVGDVFGSYELQKRDSGIAQSYEKYKNLYDNIVLDTETVTKLVELADKNIWFKYLRDSFNKDIGWIDFEKEISTAIRYFGELLNVTSNSVILEKAVSTQEGRYIVSRFSFLWEEMERKNLLHYGLSTINGQYTVEYPYGSNNMIINKEKVIDVLSNAVFELAEGLKIYLKNFIEAVVDSSTKKTEFKLCDAFQHTNYAVTFNYTNTFESLYSNNQVFHLHGTVNDKIVLGVNPDESDAIATVDTSFIAFKKYFQRVLYETDMDYQSWIEDCRIYTEDRSLVVMGHSLDITDKDIIAELFDISTEIIILYHSKEAEKGYIANLVNIFGMDKFLMLRTEKKLRFLPLDMDFTEFARKRKNDRNYDVFSAVYVC